ncbi:MAG TPA: hypothetical protein V6C97_14270, partial [Oculatellaceae cyanobacterium]
FKAKLRDELSRIVYDPSKPACSGFLAFPFDLRLHCLDDISTLELGCWSNIANISSYMNRNGMEKAKQGR